MLTFRNIINNNIHSKEKCILYTRVRPTYIKAIMAFLKTKQQQTNICFDSEVW